MSELPLSTLTLESFATKHLELLELERNAEVEENRCLRESCSAKELQKQGVGIPNLCIESSSTGLFGRTIMKFQQKSKSPLPANSITSGDIVGIGVYEGGHLQIVSSGVVLNIGDISMSVAFDEEPDVQLEGYYAVVKLANDVTYKRIKRVLKALPTKGQDHPLVDILFGGKEPTAFDEDQNIRDLENKGLNPTQQSTVRFCLQQRHLSIIHGPPGTGKTTTVVECIVQAVKQNNKVLACAPSNIAVDNLLEKLTEGGVTKVVRLGHPGRALPALRPYALDAIVARYDGSDVLREMKAEVDKIRARMGKCRGAGERRNLRSEQRSLLRDVRGREKRIVAHILSHADVVLATLTSSSEDGPLHCLESPHFDLCVIDECSQATEAACWIPLLRCRRCILAGDHQQLPPTIVSREAATGGMQVSLLERAAALHTSCVRMLTTQYRMHEAIMLWPSRRLYEGRLVADDSVRTHLLEHLPGVEENQPPLLIVDTSPLGLREVEEEGGGSRGNEGEADVAAAHAKQLLSSGLKGDQVAIITPYSLQAELIRNRLAEHPQVEVKSVDGFQGREKEAVILSLVRSNENKEVGFLSEDRRINVAITRARRHLAVICDTTTVSSHDFLKDFVDYCERNGEYRTAFDYEEDIGGHRMTKASKTSDVAKKKKANRQEPSRRKTEEEKKQLEDEYEKVLRDFVVGSEDRLPFPSSLNAFQRRALHEVAERLGLLHISSGEGSERAIEIRKAPCNEQPHSNLNDIGTTSAFVTIDAVNLKSSSDLDTSTSPVKITKLLESVSSAKINAPEIGCDDLSEDLEISSKDSEIVLDGASSFSSTKTTSTSLTASSDDLCDNESTESLDKLQKFNSGIVVNLTSNRPDSDLTLKNDAKISQGLTSKPPTISNQTSKLSASPGLTSKSNTNKNKDITSKSSTSSRQTTKTETNKNKSLTSELSTTSDLTLMTDVHSNKNLTSKPATVLNLTSKPSTTSKSILHEDLPPTAVERTLFLPKSSLPKTKKPAKKAPKPKLKELPLEEDDFDALLANVTKADNVCRFDKCKTSVAVLVQVCSHCKNRFCCSHSMPEVHGCGDAARAEARRMHKKVTDKSKHESNPALRGYLHKKLDKKLNEMAGQRKHKKKD